jgi:hypothetical protein
MNEKYVIENIKLSIEGGWQISGLKGIYRLLLTAVSDS